MATLNVGKGQCQGTARLLIKPVQAVIELGASNDVLMKTLNAVHHANRHGSVEDFIAVAFPLMKMGRKAMLPGHEIELIGSETSLGNLVGLEGIMRLCNRGMILDLEIEEAFLDEGMIGAAYMRDQSVAKNTPGWIRRTRARAARRGKTIAGKTNAGKTRVSLPDRSALALFYADKVIHVRETVGEVSQAPMMVSTYGFSSISAPAILPVMPESAREVTDAA